MLAALRPVARTIPSRSALVARHSSHGPNYNAPTGHLFGEQVGNSFVLGARQKRVKQDWENIYYYGMGGGMALGAVLIYYKPDTSLEGWARKEAEARMAGKGETPTYVKS
ncbi:hypothetical protein RQP46_008962 [Phenoliferia psychrophenolica]